MSCQTAPQGQPVPPGAHVVWWVATEHWLQFELAQVQLRPFLETCVPCTYERQLACEYGAKQMTEDGQPAEVGKRRGPIGMVLNTFEWAARFVVHYPQYIWFFAVIDRIDIFFWAYAAVNVLYLAKTLLAICLLYTSPSPRDGLLSRMPSSA